jgi:perosamine synthetase
MTNLQGAIGLAQLEQVDRLVAARRKTAARYLKHLKGMRGLQLPAEKPWAKNVYWMFGVVLDASVTQSREEVTSALKADGIDTRPFFQPLHSQPAMQKAGCAESRPFPVAQNLASRGFYLPSTSDLPEATVKRVAASLARALQA